MVRIQSIEVKLTHNEKEILMNVSKLQGKSMSELVRARVFCGNGLRDEWDKVYKDRKEAKNRAEVKNGEYKRNNRNF